MEQQRRAEVLGSAAAAWVSTVLLLMAAAPAAHAHGILTKPASRNWMEYLNNNYYW